jgi:hypothetical protein
VHKLPGSFNFRNLILLFGAFCLSDSGYRLVQAPRHHVLGSQANVRPLRLQVSPTICPVRAARLSKMHAYEMYNL